MEQATNARRSRRVMVVGVLVAAVLVVIAPILLLVVFLSSPLPSIKVFARAFERGHPKPPEHYASLKRQVCVRRDLEYPSTAGSNTFDLYEPTRYADQAGQAKLPVIVWIHGGGFIAGDKSWLATYATMLAAQGYAVVNMNYSYAPQGLYPTPVIQVGEMVRHLDAIAGVHHLDVNDISIGGDSAGAQIAAQFAAVQTTSGYARRCAIPRIPMHSQPRSLVLFCGPYDLKAFAKVVATGSWIERWFVNTIGWGTLVDAIGCVAVRCPTRPWSITFLRISLEPMWSMGIGIHSPSRADYWSPGCRHLEWTLMHHSSLTTPVCHTNSNLIFSIRSLLPCGSTPLPSSRERALITRKGRGNGSIHSCQHVTTSDARNHAL